MATLEKYFVPIARRKYQEALFAAVPLNEISEFHDDEEISNAAKQERKNALEQFIRKISTLDGDKISELIKELDKELEEATLKYQKKNKEHRKQSELLMEQILGFMSKQYESFVQVQLSLNPYSDLTTYKEILESKRTDVITAFEKHWKPGDASFHKAYKFKLEDRLKTIQNNMEDKLKKFLDGPAVEEKMRCEEMKTIIFAKLQYLKEKMGETGVTRQIVTDMVQEMKLYLSKNTTFLKPEFQETHCRIVEVLTEADTKAAKLPVKAVSKDALLKWLKEFSREIKECFREEKQVLALIDQIMGSRYEEFRKNLDTILQKYPNRYFDPANLERYHKVFANEQLRLFKTEFSEKVRKTGPSNTQCNALLELMNQDWPSLKTQNEKKMNTVKEERTKKQSQKHSYAKSDIPLIIKYSGSWIAFATFENGNFEIHQNPLGETETPLMVGINYAGEFVYGTDARALCRCNEVMMEVDEEQTKHWWIPDLFITSDFPSVPEQMQVKLPNEQFKFNIKVTAEFFLAYIIKTLKRSVEKKLRKEFDSSLVAVPFCLYSTHRIQIKDALTMAGFTKTMLVNDESAAAFAYYSQNNPLSKPVYTNLRQVLNNQNVSVLSETHGVVTGITFTSHNGISGIVRMLNNVILDVRSYHQRNQSRSHCNQTFLDDRSKAQVMNQICNNAIQHLQSTSWICLADSEWQQAFQTARKARYANNPSLVEFAKHDGMESRHVGMFGCALLTRTGWEELGNILQDSLAYDVKIDQSTRNQGQMGYNSYYNVPTTAVIRKNTYIHEPINLSPIMCQSGTRVFQENLSNHCQVILGEVELSHTNASYTHVYQQQQTAVEPKINSESIITFEVSRPAQHHYGSYNTQENFIWKTPNLNEEQKQDITTKITNIFEAIAKGVIKKESEIEKSKDLLQGMCDNLELLELEGKFLFQAKFEEQRFHNSIEKARLLLSDANVSLEKIQGEIYKLNGWLEQAYSI